MQWKDKRVLVIGKGVGGCALANRLTSLGAEILLYDDNDFLPSVYRQITMATVSQAMPLDCAVISPAVLSTHPLVAWLTQRGVPVLSELDVGFLLCRASVVAITGTNGKTTTVRLLQHLLTQAGVASVACGNIGVPFCSIDLPAEGVAVVEVSSFQLEQSKLFACRYAAITNIAEDHLSRHKTMQEYRRLKARLLSMAKEGYARNADDTTLPTVDKPCYAYSLSQSWTTAYVAEGNICLRTRQGVKNVLTLDRFPLVGKHNLYNALCALSLAYATAGYSDAYGNALTTFRPDPMRLQRIQAGERVAYDDSKSTNIASTRAALQCITRPCVLMLGGYDKGESFVDFFADMPANVRLVVVFGAVGERLYAEAKQAEYEQVTRVESVEQGVEEAMAYADCDLLFSPACSSFDAYSSYKERGHAFEQAFFALAR